MVLVNEVKMCNIPKVFLVQNRKMFCVGWNYDEFMDLTFDDFSCHNFVGQGKES